MYNAAPRRKVRRPSTSSGHSRPLCRMPWGRQEVAPTRPDCGSGLQPVADDSALGQALALVRSRPHRHGVPRRIRPWPGPTQLAGCQTCKASQNHNGKVTRRLLDPTRRPRNCAHVLGRIFQRRLDALRRINCFRHFNHRTGEVRSRSRPTLGALKARLELWRRRAQEAQTSRGKTSWEECDNHCRLASPWRRQDNRQSSYVTGSRTC